MTLKLTASDRSALIRLASELPKGSEERKSILGGLSKTANFSNRGKITLRVQPRGVGVSFEISSKGFWGDEAEDMASSARSSVTRFVYYLHESLKEKFNLELDHLGSCREPKVRINASGGDVIFSCTCVAEVLKQGKLEKEMVEEAIKSNSRLSEHEVKIA